MPQVGFQLLDEQLTQLDELRDWLADRRDHEKLSRSEVARQVLAVGLGVWSVAREEDVDLGAERECRLLGRQLAADEFRRDDDR